MNFCWTVKTTGRRSFECCACTRSHVTNETAVTTQLPDTTLIDAFYFLNYLRLELQVTNLAHWSHRSPFTIKGQCKGQTPLGIEILTVLVAVTASYFVCGHNTFTALRKPQHQLSPRLSVHIRLCPHTPKSHYCYICILLVCIWRRGVLVHDLEKKNILLNTSKKKKLVMEFRKTKTAISLSYCCWWLFGDERIADGSTQRTTFPGI